MAKILGKEPGLGKKKISELIEDKGKLLKERLSELGLSQNYLEDEVEGFRDLSLGQKFLFIENYQQLSLSRIKEESYAEYKSSFKKVGFNLKAENLKNFSHNVWQGLAKHYKLAKIERDKANSFIDLAGEPENKVLLEQLSSGLKNNGPEAELSDRGELEISFFQIDKELLEKFSEEEKVLFENLQSAGREFGQLPDDWRYKTAKESERKKFNQAYEKYSSARWKFNSLIEKKWAEENNYSNEDFQKIALAMSALAEGERKMELQRFLSANPEVEKQLLDIKNKSLWKQFFKGTFTEKGLYMSLGYLSRAFASFALGAAAVPVATSTIGFFRSRKRALDSLKEKDVMGRRGLKQSGDMAKNFLEVKNSNKKLEDLIEKIENESDEKKRLDLAYRLRQRLNFVEEKSDQGLINFGVLGERVDNYYEYQKTLSRAQAFVKNFGINDLGEEEQEKSWENFSEISKRLDKFLEFKDKKISQERKRYVITQAFKGAGIALGFSLLGRQIAALFEDGQMPEEIRQVNESGQQEQVVLPEENAPALNETEAGPSAIEPEVQSDLLPAPEEINTPEINPELETSPSLINNPDLQGTLSSQTVSLYEVEAGQGLSQVLNDPSMGQYNYNEVHFIQPDGQEEIAPAGERYIHTGDKVVLTENGDIYVLKDSGIRALVVETPEANVEDIEPMEKLEVKDVSLDEGQDEIIIGDQSDKELVLDEAENVNQAPVVERQGEKIENISEAEDLNIKKELPEKEEVFQSESYRETNAEGENELVVYDEINAEDIPESFSEGKTINQDMAESWAKLSKSEQEVYRDFEHNLELLKQGQGLSASEAFFDEPVENLTYMKNSETNFVVTFENGHLGLVSAKGDDMYLSVDGHVAEKITPKYVIKVRDYLDKAGPPKDYEIPNEDLVPEENVSEPSEIKGNISNEILPSGNTLETLDPELNDLIPVGKELNFDTQYSPEEELHLQTYYDKRLESFDIFSLEYPKWALQYDNPNYPKFDRFHEVVKTYLETENMRVKMLEEAAEDKTLFPKVEKMVEDWDTFNPLTEVKYRLNHIAEKVKLREAV